MLKQIQNLTIGIEEEYQLIDPNTRELTSYISEILEQGSLVFKDEVKPELLQSQIETKPSLQIQYDQSEEDRMFHPRLHTYSYLLYNLPT